MAHFSRKFGSLSMHDHAILTTVKMVQQEHIWFLDADLLDVLCSVQSAVIKVFQGGGLQTNELYSLNESIR